MGNGDFEGRKPHTRRLFYGVVLTLSPGERMKPPFNFLELHPRPSPALPGDRLLGSGRGATQIVQSRSGIAVTQSWFIQRRKAPHVHFSQPRLFSGQPRYGQSLRSCCGIMRRERARRSACFKTRRPTNGASVFVFLSRPCLVHLFYGSGRPVCSFLAFYVPHKWPCGRSWIILFSRPIFRCR
jgi:hypothetical protein